VIHPILNHTYVFLCFLRTLKRKTFIDSEIEALRVFD